MLLRMILATVFILLLQGCSSSKTHELYSPCVAIEAQDNGGQSPCVRRRVNDNLVG